MPPQDYLLLVLLARSPAGRQAVQRWAMRYTSTLLRRIGGPHTASAELLCAIGSARSGDTMVGGQAPRAPAPSRWNPPLPTRRRTIPPRTK